MMASLHESNTQVVVEKPTDHREAKYVAGVFLSRLKETCPRTYGLGSPRYRCDISNSLKRYQIAIFANKLFLPTVTGFK